MCWTALAIAYLWRLGLIPIHATADECRRALVPLEMVLRGDGLTPTINGEIYLNKPPLFSWLVAGSYSLFGEVSPFTARFPVVVSILATGIIVYYGVRRYTTAATGAVTALAYMTCWRTLTLDSMLALVEHTLALLTYGAFLLIYMWGERGRYLLLFLTTYVLTALVFLIKGMPALYHQGMALLVYFIAAGRFRQLISLSHLAGILLMCGVLAAYYAPFFLQQDLPPAEVYGKLFGESTKRFAWQGGMDFFYVLLDFPPDFIKHFMPWTLLGVALFFKTVRQAVRAHAFVRYNALLFLAIVPVYWIASFKNPHYFYFLLPSFFTVVVYAWHQMPRSAWLGTSMRWIVFGALILLGLVGLYLPFHAPDSGDRYTFPVLAGCALMFILLAWRQWVRPHTLWALAAGLILIRVVFNMYVMPRRVDDQMTFPRLAQEIDNLVATEALAICASYPAGFYDPITYPLENQRRAILPVVDHPAPGQYYLMDSVMHARVGGTVLMEFPFVYMDNLERHAGVMRLVRAPSLPDGRQEDSR